MDLRKKTLIVVVITIIALLVTLSLVASSLLIHDYLALEQEYTLQALGRTANVVEERLATIDANAADWAAWDDTYQFITDRNPAYINATLGDSSFSHLQINFMLYITDKGTVLYSKGYDLDHERAEPPDAVPDMLPSLYPRLILHSSPTDGHAGIVTLPRGPALVASYPIVTSDQTGPIRGTLIMGRYLNDGEIAKIAGIVHRPVTFTTIDSSIVTIDAWADMPGQSTVVAHDDVEIGGYQLVQDIDGVDRYVLGIEIERDIFHQGQRSLFFILLSIFGTGLLFGIITVSVLEKDVLKRLSTLTRAVDVIGSCKIPAARIDVDRANDEITALTKSINSMMSSLQETHQQLIESERKYHHLVSNLPVGLCRIALVPGGKFIMVNPTLVRLFGFTDAFEINRYSVVDFYDNPADRDVFVDQLVSKGSVNDYETRLRRGDGTPFWGRVSAQLIKDAEGPSLYYDAVIEDVTDKKWAEEALRIASLQWHKFLEVSPDPMWIVDLSGKYLAVNVAFLAVADSSIEDVIGKTSSEVLPDLHANIAVPEDSALPDDGYREAEVTIVSNNEKCTFLVKKVTLRSPSGVPTGMLGIARDITERIRIERSLVQANQKLNILSSVTRHDVLNQLTAIRGYIDLAHELIAEPLERTYLETAASVCVKMQSLIAFTKDYQNMGVHKPEWQPVQTLFRRAAETLPTNTIQLRIDTGTLELYSDPLLEKVFYNLMENAIRHGQRVTRISVSYRIDQDGLTLLVEDNGIGVPDFEKHRIFDQGYGKNTGYGLFLIHEILAITDMTIKETGEPGIGARFEIRVPKHNYRFGAEGNTHHP